MYTFKTSERNNEKATEYETKSLLYLMTRATNSDNVDLFIIDCFNDVTGVSNDFGESWDIQSKGVASLTPQKIGSALFTLYANYLSDISFGHYILFVPPIKETYIEDCSLDVFSVNNFELKRIDEIQEGLRKEILARKDDDVISKTSPKHITDFLNAVIFVADNFHKSDYIRRIIQFKSFSRLDETFLNKIFDEIRNKQAGKKIPNVYGKSVDSLKDALKFEKYIHRKDLELLVVNRIIGNDLFSNRGVPLFFLSIVKDMDPEDITDLLINCQSKISQTLFNKNNKRNFWLLLEVIMRLVVDHPKFDIEGIFNLIPTDTQSRVFTLDKNSTLYLIAVVKEGVQRENTTNSLW